MPMVSAGALTLDLETGNGCELTSTEHVTSLLLAQSSGGRKRRLGSPGSQAGRHGLPHTGLAEPGAPGRRTLFPGLGSGLFGKVEAGHRIGVG